MLAFTPVSGFYGLGRQQQLVMEGPFLSSLCAQSQYAGPSFVFSQRTNELYTDRGPDSLLSWTTQITPQHTSGTGMGSRCMARRLRSFSSTPRSTATVESTSARSPTRAGQQTQIRPVSKSWILIRVEAELCMGRCSLTCGGLCNPSCRAEEPKMEGRVPCCTEARLIRAPARTDQLHPMGRQTTGMSSEWILSRPVGCWSLAYSCEVPIG